MESLQTVAKCFGIVGIFILPLLIIIIAYYLLFLAL